MWTRITDVRAFLAQKGVKRVRDHHTLTKRVLHWPYCAHCGLVALNNEPTRKAMRAKCITYEDEK